MTDIGVAHFNRLIVFMRNKCEQPNIANALISFTVLVTGCSLEQDISRTPRTAVEQLLLTQAVERAAKNLTVTIPDNSSLHVEVTGLQTDRSHIHVEGANRGVLYGPSLDLLLIRDSVSVGLARLGHRIEPRDTVPAYLARVVVESFGTVQSLTFFGLPFSLPSLYKAQTQNGYARVHIDFFEYQTGRLISSTETLIGCTYYNQYTLLFLFSWHTTDLTSPP